MGVKWTNHGGGGGTSVLTPGWEATRGHLYAELDWRWRGTRVFWKQISTLPEKQ